MKHFFLPFSIVSWLMVLCFLGACGSKKDTEQILVSFPVTDTLDLIPVLVPAEILLQPTAAFATDEYLVVFQRKTENLFYFFDRSDLSFVFSAGKMGRAANEFVFPDIRFFKTTSRGFKMLDYNSIKHFEIQKDNIELISTEQLLTANTINNLQVLNDTLFCYSNSDPTRAHEFVLLNTKGDLREISPYPTWKEGNPEQRIFTYLSNVVSEQKSGRFMAFYAYFCRAKLFNSDGELLKEIVVEIPDRLTEQPVDPGQRCIAYGAVPITDQKYIYAIYFNQSTIKKSSEIHVFSWEGDPVARWVVKQFVDIVTLAPDGKKLYFIDSQNGEAIYWCSVPAL